MAATNPSRRSSNPPCPGMMWLESLTPNRRFTANSKRSPSWEATESDRAEQENRTGSSETGSGKCRSDREARHETADRAGPGLFRTDPRPEFRPADAAARKVAANVGDPYHQKDQNQRDKVRRPGRDAPQPMRSRRQRRSANPGRSPTAPLRRKRHDAGEADDKHKDSDASIRPVTRNRRRHAQARRRRPPPRAARARPRSSAIRHRGRPLASVTSAIHIHPPA